MHNCFGGHSNNGTYEKKPYLNLVVFYWKAYQKITELYVINFTFSGAQIITFYNIVTKIENCSKLDIALN